MTKTIDPINEIVRTAKRPFPDAASRPGRARQHRCERRRIKEHMQIQHWMEREF